MSQPPTSKYPDMGEVTTLRLELCRERDRANAFEKALTTEVLKVAKVAIYQAMLDADSKAADTIGCMGVEVDDLKAENARLKAENENAWGSARTYSRLWIEAKENKERIEAEVERLTAELSNISGWGRGLESDLSHARVEISFLKAEAERLRKAGDAMQKRLIFLHDRWDSDEPNIESEAWNAAKEGKQP